MKLYRLFAAALVIGGCSAPLETPGEEYNLISQHGGPTLGYSPESGVSIIIEGRHAFKDLNRNGVLDTYEDWRVPAEKRAEDLAAQLSIEEIAGLMLYSNHQALPSAELSEVQMKFLKEDNLRHVLITTVASPEVAAHWNNAAQAFVEGLAHGIPANNSSDPRHNARSDAEFNAGGGGDISMWPGSLGMAATFDPELMREFGRIASKEYRALGLATALSPQVDIATEPRWLRFNGTTGEDPELGTAMAEAYCDGFQTSEGDAEIADGWGWESVNAMVKHWPGGGPVEAGRDAHYGFGKFSVYPGEGLAIQKKPFLEGAFKLKGKTKMASAVMPYYTISWNQSDENVANSFNHDIIQNQLRNEVGYEGVICTDWGVTHDYEHPGKHAGKPWGVEGLSIAERHYRVLMAGVDQFGGNNDKGPVLEAYELGVAEHGKDWMDARMRMSAKRLLLNIFRTGLFENPYVDPSTTAAIVGCPEFMARGYEAQQKSVVLLKNSCLPLAEGTKVYVPSRTTAAYVGFWGEPHDAMTYEPLSAELGNKYFEMVATPEEADAAIVFIESPFSRYGYSFEDLAKGGNGYVPISLQYSDYTAVDAREHSIAGGDPFEASADRSYKGKSIKTVNKADMEQVQSVAKQMGGKPVIVVVNTTNPFIPAEIEPYASALLLTFDIQTQAVLDVISGKFEPCGRLPMQMPADMHTVETQCEDLPHDMVCYTDASGNVYDFAFGLSFSGPLR